MSRPDRNYPLYIGAALSLLILVLVIFGPALAPRDPAKMETDFMVIGGETLVPSSRPVPPFRAAIFPLGTDDIGRDLLSRILWAFRPTMLLCLIIAAVRLAVGVPLGLVGAWYRGPVERLIELLISASLSVPLLVVAVAVVSFIGAHRGLIAFVVGLSLVGWADTAALVRSRALAVAQEPFIESARAVGVRARDILRRHILPQLWPILPALIAFELAAVTLLVAELGFLGIYIGGGFIYLVQRGDVLDDYRMMTERYPELGQMLSAVWARIIKAPWQPAIVGGIVMLMVLAFNLLGEGLRRQMDITRPRRRGGWAWRRRPSPANADSTTSTPRR